MKEEKRNKRQDRRDRAQQQARKNRLITMGVILLIAAALVGLTIWNQARPILDIVSVESGPRPNAEGASMGDPNAPIQIVEYGDFQCPHCKNFATDTEPLLREYFAKTGKIRFTYRSAGNWVSSSAQAPNAESQAAAEAAYCAGDQNKFWEMHDSLFANTRDVENQGSFSDKRLAAMAESVGLDMTAFNDCYKNGNGKYADRVQKDFDEGTAVGLNGTPFFVITYKVNGETQTETLEGARSINEFQQKIEAALLIADKSE